MDLGWLIQLPDLKDWVKEGEFVFFRDLQTMKIIAGRMGNIPRELLMGVIFQYHHKNDKSHVLCCYFRFEDLKHPVFMRWVERGEWNLCGAAIWCDCPEENKGKKHWHLKRLCQSVKWYFRDPGDVKSFYLRFEVDLNYFYSYFQMN